MVALLGLHGHVNLFAELLDRADLPIGLLYDRGVLGGLDLTMEVLLECL